MTPVVAATGAGVARLDLGGDTTQVELAAHGSGISCLARDPRDPDFLVGGGRGAGVWESSDGGGNWERVDFPHEDVFSVAVSGADGAVYAGCEPSMLFVSRDRGGGWTELASLREIPSAPTWSFPPRPWTSHVRWIAPSPHDARLLLVGIELGGVMRTTTAARRGATIGRRPAATATRSPCTRARPAGPTRRAAAARPGASTAAPRGRRPTTAATATTPGRSRSIRRTPTSWFVSASTGPYAAHGRGSAEAVVYRWRGSGPWEPLAGGLPQPLDEMPYALAFADGLLLAGLADGTIYASRDSGDSWEHVPLDGESPERILAFA